MTTTAARLQAHFGRAVAEAILTTIALVGSTTCRELGWAGDDLSPTVATILAIAFLLLGFLTVRSFSREFYRISRARIGTSAASTIRLTSYAIGDTLVALITLALLKVEFTSLVAGIAATGVVVGIAAQQVLSNFFAGLMILTVRPFTAGDTITIRSGGMGGPYEGKVLAIGLTFTTIETDEGVFMLPNSGVMNSGLRRPDPQVLGVVETPEAASAATPPALPDDAPEAR